MEAVFGNGTSVVYIVMIIDKFAVKQLFMVLLCYFVSHCRWLQIKGREYRHHMDVFIG